MLDHLIDDHDYEDADIQLQPICRGAITHATALLHCDLSFEQDAMVHEIRKALYRWQSSIE